MGNCTFSPSNRQPSCCWPIDSINYIAAKTIRATTTALTELTVYNPPPASIAPFQLIPCWKLLLPTQKMFKGCKTNAVSNCSIKYSVCAHNHLCPPSLVIIWWVLGGLLQSRWILHTQVTIMVCLFCWYAKGYLSIFNTLITNVFLTRYLWNHIT